MAGGLAALLDDIAALARMAAASADDVALASARAGAKSAGVVVDDTAVTPQYVRGLDPKRELPIIWRIARGSLINKLVIILPIALVLSTFAPWLLPPILILGGLFLSFEGAEKIWELMTGHHEAEPAVAQGADAEKSIVSGAVRTDLILSAEIMVIALNEVASEALWARAIILVIVGIGITALVYGAVGILVKMDDIGLAMSRQDSAARRRIGAGLVAAMPRVMNAISVIGMIAMIWVGGHIVLTSSHEMGLAQPYGWVHGIERAAAALPAIGGLLGWLANTFFSLLLGLLLGGAIAVIVHGDKVRRAARSGRSAADPARS